MLVDRGLKSVPRKKYAPRIASGDSNAESVIENKVQAGQGRGCSWTALPCSYLALLCSLLSSRRHMQR